MVRCVLLAYTVTWIIRPCLSVCLCLDVAGVLRLPPSPRASLAIKEASAPFNPIKDDLAGSPDASATRPALASDVAFVALQTQVLELQTRVDRLEAALGSRHY